MTWAPDYLTTQQAKDYLGVTDTLDDVQLALWVTAASRAIDKRCNRQFGSVSTLQARTYRRSPYFDAESSMWLLDIDDVYDSTGMIVGGVPLASSGWTLQPDNAPVESRPWTQLGYFGFPAYPPSQWLVYPYTPMVISALWGWASIPSQVVVAGQLQVSRWNFRRQSPAGVAGSPDSGSEVRLLARLDPDVATSLMGLSRRRRAG